MSVQAIPQNNTAPQPPIQANNPNFSGRASAPAFAGPPPTPQMQPPLNADTLTLNGPGAGPNPEEPLLVSENQGPRPLSEEGPKFNGRKSLIA